MVAAQRPGLGERWCDTSSPAARAGVNAYFKVGCPVAGMGAGADSIDDMGAARGALPYRPRSGRGLEEVSVGLMAYLDP
jgi:hypothetical protein